MIDSPSYYLELKREQTDVCCPFFNARIYSIKFSYALKLPIETIRCSHFYITIYILEDKDNTDFF